MRRGKARPWDSMYEPWWVHVVIIIAGFAVGAAAVYWYANKQLGP